MIAFAFDGIMSFSILPLRVATYLGVVVGAASVLYAMSAIFAHSFLNATVPGWTTTVVLVSFLFSVQLLVTGVLGEYIGRIYEQVKGRPLYIVGERIRHKKVRKRAHAHDVGFVGDAARQAADRAVPSLAMPAGSPVSPQAPSAPPPPLPAKATSSARPPAVASSPSARPPAVASSSPPPPLRASVKVPAASPVSAKVAAASPASVPPPASSSSRPPATPSSSPGPVSTSKLTSKPPPPLPSAAKKSDKT
jgi:hypothetical protein